MKLTVKLIGNGAYSPSRPITSENTNRSDYTDFERKVWKERIHVNRDNLVSIPCFGIKNMIDSTASYLGDKMRGNSTFAKVFRAGVIITPDKCILNINGKPLHIDDVNEKDHGEWVFVHADGKRTGGSGTRVNRLFALFYDWSTEFSIETLDERITQQVLERHLVAAGQFNGIGRFRPQVGGIHGRFNIEIK